MKALPIAHLSAAKFTLLALVLGVGLSLPALRAGLIADDYPQRETMLGTGGGAGSRPLFDLYSFIPAGPRRSTVHHVGELRWWTDPEIHAEFFRPLAALTFVADYAVWPDVFWLQHLHSLAWFGLAVVVVALFYRGVHGAGAIAGLAAILFAVDDAHAMCSGWLANRHALVSLVFGVAALEAHRRWRAGKGAAWCFGAVASLALALLAGESGLAAAAYIAAWQLTMDESRRPKRLAALLPTLIVIVAWRLAYVRLGYGTHGSGLYIDPGDDPVAFVRALVERWPVLQAALWFRIPIDLSVTLSRAQLWGLTIVSAALVGLVSLLLVPVLRERREARFWAAGMVLALVPLCAAFPMDRLLLFSGIGAFPLLALLAERCGLLGGATAPLRSWRRLALFLLVLHGPVAAALLPLRMAALARFQELLMAGGRNLAADSSAPHQTFVFVAAYDIPAFQLWIMRRLESPATAPGGMAILGPSAQPIILWREANDRIAISVRDGLFHEPIDTLLRDVDAAFRVGERVESAEFTAEVRSITPDGRPLEVAFHFRRPLEDPRLRWLTWTAKGPRSFPLPAVGERVEVAPVSLGDYLRASEVFP